MATDSINDTPSSDPWPECPRCHHPLRFGGTFCSNCGNRLTGPMPIHHQPAIEQGKLVGSDGFLSDAVLRHVDHIGTSQDLPMKPQIGSPLSRPLTPRDKERSLLNNGQPGSEHIGKPRNHAGFTDTLSVFKPSGPLGKSVDEMLDEYKQRSQPQVAASGQQPPRYPPTAVGAPAPTPEPQPQRAHFDTGELQDLPAWLQNAALQPTAQPEPKDWQVPAPKPKPAAIQHTEEFSWLNTSGKSHSVFSTPMPPALSPEEKAMPATERRRAIPKAPAEPYPPLPDNTIPCTRCHGCGVIYPSGVRCPANCNNGRVLAPPPPIPQPAPDIADVTTARDATDDERAMLAQLQAQPPKKQPDMSLLTTMSLEQMMAADKTGAAALVLEAIKAEPPKMPQTTDAIEGLVEETEGPRKHLQELLTEVAEGFTGVHIQAGANASRCLRYRDQLQGINKRLMYMDQEELAVLGLTEKANEKALDFLLKAVEDAKAAEQKLRYVEMALEVGIAHAQGWLDTFGQKKGA